MIGDMGAYFDCYGWSCQQIAEDVWRATFVTEQVGEFELYVARSDQWIHFAISPFTPLPQPSCQAHLYRTLLQLNQQLRMARFAVDEDGDVNLLIDVPQTSLDYVTFANSVDILVQYTQQLGHELARTATESDYQSPQIHA